MHMESTVGDERPVATRLDSLEDIGNILTERGDMDKDTAVKRARFIQSAVETAQAEIIRATKIYSCSFYGSNLWDLTGSKAQQFYTAWNNCVKMAWGCP